LKHSEISLQKPKQIAVPRKKKQIWMDGGGGIGDFSFLCMSSYSSPSNSIIWCYNHIFLFRNFRTDLSLFFLVLPRFFIHFDSPLTPNDPYIGRTAPLTSRCCILYIYSTNIRTEYLKHAA